MKKKGKKHPKVAFVGAGKMAVTILRRFLESGFLGSASLFVSRKRKEKLDELAGQFPGCQMRTSSLDAAREAEVVILAVKPKDFPDVLAELAGQLTSRQLVISIVTGVGLTHLAKLGSKNFIRATTNIGIEVGAGVTFWSASPDISSEAREAAAAIFANWGSAMEIHDEDLHNILIVGAGSGPAMVIEFVESFSESLVVMGMAADMADDVVLLVSEAVMKLLRAKPRSFWSEFKRKVMTPGGITIEMFQELYRRGFRSITIDACKAAHNKTLKIVAQIETLLASIRK